MIYCFLTGWYSAGSLAYDSTGTSSYNFLVRPAVNSVTLEELNVKWRMMVGTMTACHLIVFGCSVIHGDTLQSPEIADDTEKTRYPLFPQTLERLRVTFTVTANLNLYYMTTVSLFLSFTVHILYWKICSLMPFLSISVVLDSFYLLILYFEKFSTWTESDVYRLP